jgi:transcription elongation factor GreA
MQRIPMTPAGHKKLREELDRLVRVERPRNVRDIEEARAHGDLSENAEYHAAKERQSFIFGRIQELKNTLALAEVIDPSRINHDRVAFGATVKLLELESDMECIYSIVGAEEADIKSGKISVGSPVARALIGKEVGEEVTVRAPARTIRYEIMEIVFE